MNFYTGMQTIEMFNVIFIFIKPYLLMPIPIGQHQQNTE